MSNLCESLFTWDDNYQQQPALATRVDHPDALTYVFTLREGVTFWDGKPMTSEDVAYSINRILDPKLASSWASWAATAEPTIEATGPLEVTVKLKKPDSMLANYFATPAFEVIEKDFTEQAGKAFGTSAKGVMCTGPYKFGSWKPGSSVTIERNDAWWNTDNKPKVGSVKFSFTVDPAAQIAALASGDVQGQWSLPTSSLKQLDKTGGSLLFARSLAPTFLGVLNDKGALSNLKVREALQASINYDGIQKSVYLGTGAPLRALVPPEAWGYGKKVYQDAWDALPAPEQKLAMAKKLVAAAPEAEQRIVLAYNTSSAEEVSIATVVADGAKQAGLNIKLKPLTAEQGAAVFSSAEARKGIDLMMITGYLDFADPAEYYEYFTTTSYYNFAGYSNPDYDKAIAQAFATEDPDGKAAAVVKAQSILSEEKPVIPIATRDLSLYYGKGLAGLAPHQSFLYKPWAAKLGGK
ncbi:hypothetical protein ASE12_14115 [Aeromicrobium sp. Root236]|nr:hypothetical protein ASE12_14115 [Aeromicrobium sp. Root236]